MITGALQHHSVGTVFEREQERLRIPPLMIHWPQLWMWGEWEVKGPTVVDVGGVGGEGLKGPTVVDVGGVGGEGGSGRRRVPA